MEILKNVGNFLKFTVSSDSSKLIYGGSLSGGASAKAVVTNSASGAEVILPYVPLIAVTVAALKLAFDIYVWFHSKRKEVKK